MAGSCVMTGPSDDGGTIDVQCTRSTGPCSETYSLVGNFSNDDHWNATLAAVYSSCADCASQSWNLTGSRI